MHGNFWIDVVNTLIQEYPEAYTVDVQDRIVSILKDVVHLEEKFAHSACKDVLGITAADYMSHFKNFANFQLRKFGLEPVYTGVGPMTWVGDFLLITEGNFFERTITEYQKGGLAWDDDDSGGLFESVIDQ
jgi:ribonucleotide reductase beta subunit family protein with ferritin-like domain